MAKKRKPKQARHSTGRDVHSQVVPSDSASPVSAPPGSFEEAEPRCISVSWPNAEIPRVQIQKRPDFPPEHELVWPRYRPSYFTDPLAPSHAAPPPQGSAVPFSGLIVGAFGLDRTQLEEAVRTFLSQPDAQKRTVVFFTDCPDLVVFRKQGLNFEYFPSKIYGSKAHRREFQDKFLTAWKRWGASKLLDLGKQGYLRKRIDNIDLFVAPPEEIVGTWDPRTDPRTPPEPVPVDVASLKAEYLSKHLDDEADTFVLYRILGNDLPPRHKSGQTLSNLRFMLENEPALENCEKRWIVNRMVDPEQESSVIALLEQYNQPYLRIPFERDEYHQVEWELEGFPSKDFFLSGKFSEMSEYDQFRAEAHARRNKNRYAINNNGARNAALRDGRDRAKWVLPWDGNCFLTQRAWQEIKKGVTQTPYFKYFIVPMSRTIDNKDLLDPEYEPEANEEPQILFRSDAQEEFDELFCYGRRPKVELFYRLGVPGPWDGWRDDRWDLPQPDLADEAGTFSTVGWVARLFSGEQKLEAAGVLSMRSRGIARIEAVNGLLDRHDIDAARTHAQQFFLKTYDEDKIVALKTASEGSSARALLDRLLIEAELAMQRGPYSVTDKTELAPSKDPHDYYHPAPYWWPNPDTPNGLPYIFKDGERVPGTNLYEPESNKFDRTRLQRLFDDTTVLALAWRATNNPDFASKASSLIKCWFINEDTMMNPNLNYAQHKALSMYKWSISFGAIEMKDVYFFLDAVRLIEKSGALSYSEIDSFRSWMTDYLEWLTSAEQFAQERASKNNHGTCFDLQIAAIASYLGNEELLHKTFRTSRERILMQFWKGGKQPHELKRTQTQHYCCFNMQSWINLAILAESCGDRLWLFEGRNGQGLAETMGWLITQMTKSKWPFEQIGGFDEDRLLPLFYSAWDRTQSATANRLVKPGHTKPIFHPHNGIAPFWMLTKTPHFLGHSASWRKLGTIVKKREAAVAEIQRGTNEEVISLFSVEELEKRLWNGYSELASTGLRAILNDPEASPSKVSNASRALAKWMLSKGQIDRALNCLEQIEPADPKDERERDLLMGYCLIRSGDTDSAKQCVSKALKRYSSDSCFLLLKAALEISDHGGKSEILLQETPAFNAIYRSRRIAPFGAVSSASRNGGDAAPTMQAPVVSAVFILEDLSENSKASICSLAAQSLEGVQIILVSAYPKKAVRSFLQTADRSLSKVSIIQSKSNASAGDQLNQGCKAAQGSFIFTQRDKEFLHPQCLELLMSDLMEMETSAVQKCAAFVTENRSVIGSWGDHFTMVPMHQDSILLRSDTLNELGGWDPSIRYPERCLAWRLEKAFGKNALGRAQSGVPLSIISRPDLALDLPKSTSTIGSATSDLEYVSRVVEARQFEIENSDSAKIDADLTWLAPADARISIKGQSKSLFLGDFRKNAVGIEQICDLLRAKATKGAPLALYHWPDFLTSAGTTIHPEILKLLDARSVSFVSTDDLSQYPIAIICSPHVTIYKPDSLKVYTPEKVRMLVASPSSIYDRRERARLQLPNKTDCEAIFSTTCTYQPM